MLARMKHAVARLTLVNRVASPQTLNPLLLMRKGGAQASRPNHD
jgi:hypothetical protein